MFALEQKPVSNLWSRIYINRSPLGIGSIFVRGRTQGSPRAHFKKGGIFLALKGRNIPAQGNALGDTLQ